MGQIRVFRSHGCAGRSPCNSRASSLHLFDLSKVASKKARAGLCESSLCKCLIGGGYRGRTGDLKTASLALCQLS